MKKKTFSKIVSILMVVMLITIIVAACTPQDEDTTKNQDSDTGDVQTSSKYPMEIEDDFGNKVTIKKAPEKIISLVPSHTEILFSLGLGDKVIGVTSYCDYPEEAKTKEVIGTYAEPNLERIIELAPDLIVASKLGDEESNARLREAGITVVGYEPESIDEVVATIKAIGKITDKVSDAEKITKDIVDRKDAVVAKVKDAEKVKVFYEVWHDPLMAAGPSSFQDNLINLARGENIAKDAKEPYPNFDLEQLIEKDPDVYLGAEEMGAESGKTVENIKTRPGYENISAVKNDRVYLLEPNIISRSGPRIIDALEMVAKALHPELFK